MKILTVWELSERIKGTLEREFSDLWVEGEISNLRSHPSGNLYFTLKDARSSVRAVIFASTARILKFPLKEGGAVLLRAHLSAYEPRSEYQLLVDYIEPRGVGALQAAFEALKERLRQEGLFDPARKRALPLLPRRVGIVTSPSGAVLQDMLKMLSPDRGLIGLTLIIFPVQVQGPGSAEQIARALDDASGRDLDLVIVARGGGSLEDLWAFNEEVCARAIAACKVPVISAVGHETDYTIADFAADHRAPTPTAAAELVASRHIDLKMRLAATLPRLEELIRRRLEDKKGALRAEARLLSAPRRRIEDLALRADDLIARAGAALIRTLALRRERATSLAARLDSLSPLAVLSRGYAVVLREGAVLRDPALVSPGDPLLIKVEKGDLHARVERPFPLPEKP